MFSEYQKELASKAEMEHGTMEQFKILIIDDVIENLKTMVSVFEEHCPTYQIFQTNSSVNAIDIAIKTLPDLIIADWEMPRVSGIELIQNLKEEPLISNIPVIIATGVMISSSNLQMALEKGAVDFVKKPLDPIELIARSNAAISMAKKHKLNLETKNAELIENALYLVKNKEFIAELTKKIRTLRDKIQSNNDCENNLLNEIFDLIKSKTSDDSLQRFNIAFYSVHEYFNKNLISRFPNLTNTDLKLCAFLRLGMSTKDIASLMYQTADSVKVSRSRLRKKMHLDQSQNLQVFLSSF